jgi:hypothetical protein
MRRLTMSDKIQDQIDELKKTVTQLSLVVTHKVGAGMVTTYSDALKRDLDALGKKIDDLLEGTIKAITTNNVEGLKMLRRK